MDGNHSQTPIVLGSTLEFATLTQNNQLLEDIGDDNKPEFVFDTIKHSYTNR